MYKYLSLGKSPKNPNQFWKLHLHLKTNSGDWTHILSNYLIRAKIKHKTKNISLDKIKNPAKMKNIQILH